MATDTGVKSSLEGLTFIICSMARDVVVMIHRPNNNPTTRRFVPDRSKDKIPHCFLPSDLRSGLAAAFPEVVSGLIGAQLNTALQPAGVTLQPAG